MTHAQVLGQPGQRIAILGLGKTGQATARALRDSGADVSIWDDQNPINIPGCTLENPVETGLSGFDALVMSPGIPLTHPTPHPAVQLAQQRGVPIVGDIELLFRTQPDAPYLAITGTNGKSTVTALTAHLFESAGIGAGVGGNLGTAVFDIKRAANAPYVLELSSYQLDLCQTTRFQVAALLNISADHLDRHGGLQGYIQAKLRIFQRQTLSDFAFISIDDDHCRSVASALERSGQYNVIKVSALTPVSGGVSAVDGLLRFDNEETPLLDLKPLSSTLPGQHNWQNAAFAAGMARAMGLRRDQIIAGLKTFRGLPHRQELLGTTQDGVKFVNDSKATNAEASQWALNAYKDIYWIVGGQAKEGGIDALMNQLDNLSGAYLIGDAAPAFAKALQTKGPRGLTSHKCGTLEKAVAQAVKDAREAGGGTILLSPACASWDQFGSFEARGDAFRALASKYF